MSSTIRFRDELAGLKALPPLLASTHIDRWRWGTNTLSHGSAWSVCNLCGAEMLSCHSQVADVQSRPANVQHKVPTFVAAGAVDSSPCPMHSRDQTLGVAQMLAAARPDVLDVLHWNASAARVGCCLHAKSAGECDGNLAAVRMTAWASRATSISPYGVDLAGLITHPLRIVKMAWVPFPMLSSSAAMA